MSRVGGEGRVEVVKVVAVRVEREVGHVAVVVVAVWMGVGGVVV